MKPKSSSSRKASAPAAGRPQIRKARRAAARATIEAARAGAAGKGFAVVASEVKALAVQTAKATDDIGSQIAAVQTSTQSAVRAIGNITGRMQEIQQFTGAIATSVEQQNAATDEISDNVAAAAWGTKSVVGVLQPAPSLTCTRRQIRCWRRRRPSRKPPTASAAASTASFTRSRCSQGRAGGPVHWHPRKSRRTAGMAGQPRPPHPPQSRRDSTHEGLRLQAPRWCERSGR